jgi:hypothetical protein
MAHPVRLVLALLAALSLAGCLETKQDILKKAQGAGNRIQLETALGKPDDISKVGPVEKWTYKATNGTVTFILAGDVVTTSLTGDKK